MTERKEREPNYDFLDKKLLEAEVTCFFKMAEIIESETTIPDSPNKEQAWINGLSQELSQGLGSTLLQTGGMAFGECFSCTFAKIDTEDSTPVKPKRTTPMWDNALTMKKQ